MNKAFFALASVFTVMIFLFNSVSAQSNPQQGSTTSAVSASHAYAVQQLTAIVGVIKQCPAGKDIRYANEDDPWYANGSPVSEFHYSAPMNVVWDIEAHPSARSMEIGSIEFIKIVGSSPMTPTPKPCKKKDTECQRRNRAVYEAFMQLLISSLRPDDSFDFRFEFDITSSGLHFTRALVKRETDDASHWKATQLGENCPDKSIQSVN